MDTSNTKLVLRRKKKFRVTSVHNSSRTARNTTLNSTLLKQTLKSNNRALARALERVRQELADTQKQLLQEIEEKQALHQKYSSLLKVAGLKNDEIESEVRERMERKLSDIREGLNKVSGSMLGTVELIHSTMALCEPRLSRGSSLGQHPRGSSMGPGSRGPSIGQDNVTESAPHRSMYYHGPRSSSSAPAAVSSELAEKTDMLLPETTSGLDIPERSHRDSSVGGMGHTGQLSIIAEQSDESDTEEERKNSKQKQRSRSRFSHRRSKSSSAVPVINETCAEKDYSSDSALTDDRPILPPDERPIVSKFAPHISGNTPQNSPNTLKNQDENEFFSTFVPIEDENKSAKPTPPVSGKCSPKRKINSATKQTNLKDALNKEKRVKDTQNVKDKNSQNNAKNKLSQQNIKNNIKDKKVQSNVKNKYNNVKDKISNNVKDKVSNNAKTKVSNNVKDKILSPEPDNGTVNHIKENVAEQEQKADSDSEVPIEQDHSEEKNHTTTVENGPVKEQTKTKEVRSKLPKRKIIRSDSDSGSEEKEALSEKLPQNTKHGLRRDTFAVNATAEKDRRATYAVEKPATKKSKRETFVLNAASEKVNEDTKEEGIFEEGDSILLDNSVADIDRKSLDTEDGMFKIPLPPQDVATQQSNKDPGIFKVPAPVVPREPSTEDTICEPEDMEFTGVVDNIEVMEEKVPLPDFITRENSMEPEFLRDTSTQFRRRTRTLSKETVVTENAETSPPHNINSTQTSPDSEKETRKTQERRDTAGEVKNKRPVNSRRTRTLSKETVLSQEPVVKDDILSDESSRQRTDSESSENEKTKKNFKTFLAKPGKITFKAGRKDVKEIIAKAKKTKAVISKTSRSKKRFVAPSTSPLNESRHGKPKSVFDLSLNESIPVPSSISYGQYVNHKTQNTAPTNSADVTQTEHGIMLVLGNGKRTKPRKRRSTKSVHYADNLAEDHLITPATQKSTIGRIEPDKKKEKAVVKNAGHTPPRKPLDESKKRKIMEVVQQNNHEVDSDHELFSASEEPVEDKPKSKSSIKKRKEVDSDQELFSASENPVEEDKPKRKSSIKKRKLLSVEKSKDLSEEEVSPAAKMPRESLIVAEKRMSMLRRLPSVFSTEGDVDTEKHLEPDLEEPEEVFSNEQENSVKQVSDVSPKARSKKRRPTVSKKKSSQRTQKHADSDGDEIDDRKSADLEDICNKRQRGGKSLDPEGDCDKRQRDTESVSSTHKSDENVLKDSTNKKHKEKKVKKEKKSKDKRKKARSGGESDVLLIPDIKEEPVSFVENPETHCEKENEENFRHQFEEQAQDLEAQGRRSRRAASSVSYKEPTLNSKLRRGDPIAKSVYDGRDAPQIFKSKKSGKKSIGRRVSMTKRSALTIITNTVKESQ